MSLLKKPHFVIKNRFQKGATTYRKLLPDATLREICFELTRSKEFTVDFVEESYNQGRLLMLYYSGKSFFISVSERNISSRNASFQSFPTALSMFILSPDENKEMAYFILPDVEGNIQTGYFLFMYRLMTTVGVRFINAERMLSREIKPFSEPEDIIAAKDKLRSRSKGNSSTYITRSDGDTVQVYGKTYGANKYETTLICLSLIKISNNVELYEVEEGGLTGIPERSRRAIEAFGRISIATATQATELTEFVSNNSLRSIRFIYNLFEKYERKCCRFCDCEIPQIVQGAHVWPVASIKRQEDIELPDQLKAALDGSNGLWLCENHHKLFDSGMLFIATSGELKFKKDMSPENVRYLKKLTTNIKLIEEVKDPAFIGYLERRNVSLSEWEYISL